MGLMEHPKKFSSTGAARDALGLDEARPNFNYAANIYWDACKEITQLESSLAEAREEIKKLQQYKQQVEEMVDLMFQHAMRRIKAASKNRVR